MAEMDTAIHFATDSQSLLFLAIVLVAFMVYVYSEFSSGQKSRNPLKFDRRRPPEPFVHDTKLRDAILKDRFKPAKVPENLDAIIIGSGAGGLSAGVLLTYAGKKVLVLEQHDQAGGCCHSFVEKGFEFDTGLHYVGELRKGDLTRVLFDQVTSGQVRWAKMDDAFDIVVVGNPSDAKWYPVRSGGDGYYQNLINMFPEEKSAILAYADMVKDSRSSLVGFLALKMLPQWLVGILVNTGLYAWLLKCYRRRYTSTSFQEVLDSLTDNEQLKLVLAHTSSDYGVLPKDTPFFLQAFLANHYQHGAYYPANGTSEVPFHMIQAIHRGGGRVLVQAPVTKILCDSTGSAVGVQVGKNEVEIRAKYIISDAGVINTFKKLLPEDVARKSNIYPLIEKVGPSCSFLTTFVGIDGHSRELKLPASNIWLHCSEDINQSMGIFRNAKTEPLEDTKIMFSFISFPSAKDPEYETKFPGKSAALAVTLVNWDWFKEWKHGKVRHRGDRYEGIKDAIGRQMWQQIVDLYPQLEGKKVYMEVGTPVTNLHYLACPNGEVYGLDHGMTRFTPDVVRKLRPDTDIRGLYLTGQDIFFSGVVPAMLSGVLCASKILKRNLINDLIKLQKHIEEANPIPTARSFKAKL